MRKSILLMGNYPPPYGGIPVHLEYLASHLARRQWDVHVLPGKLKPQAIQRIGDITLHSQLPITEYTKWELLVRNLARLWRFRSYALVDQSRFLVCLNLAERARKIIREYNVRIISAYHMFPFGFVGAWLSEEFSIPLVTTIFGEIYREPAFCKRRKQEAAYACRSSQKLLSCSIHCAKSLQLLDINFDVETIYYGIDIDAFTPGTDRSLIRRRLGLLGSDRVVIFVGRLTKEMGVMTLLESIPYVLNVKPNTRFLIVGVRAEMFDVATSWSDRYRENVFVIPDVPRAELPLYYAASTVAVVPSINDRACLGLAAAEAMASGRPVIITNVGGGPEVVAEGETGVLIRPNCSTDLAEAILNLINDDETLVKMGMRGRRRVETYFDQDKVNHKMEQIFVRLLE